MNITDDMVEAMVAAWDDTYDGMHESKRPALVAALEAALSAQPVGEPIGYFDPDVLAHLQNSNIDPVGVLRRKPNGGSTVPIYTAPQPAPTEVAYLDLGAGGYVDLGTSLADDELAKLPKGRHALGVIGTYGIDGYQPYTQPAAVPDGWVLVPKEPTKAMLLAGVAAGVKAAPEPWCPKTWGAMLDAAPSPGGQS